MVGRWFAEQLGARLTVLFVPSLALVPQTVLAYRSDPRWRHQTMIVCSDPTSGRAVALHDLDLPAWVRASVTASTSQRVIEEFLGGGGPPRLIVSTYHSAPRVAAALRDAGYTADLAVNDEAHRLAGQPRAEFRSVLDERALPARRRLFLTATPVEAEAWRAEVDDDVAAPLSLDDEETFGPTIFRGSYADGIAVGRLVDYDEGKARMPQHHREALPDHVELDLSRWCTVQRQEHRLGQMPADRITALEQVPGWEWEIGLREGYRPVLDDALHGTRRGYAKGCLCGPCTDANAAYEHARTNGATTDLVDARRARGHLRLLLGRGVAQKQLARAAGVNVKTIVEVAEGVVARIRPETEEELVALTYEAAAGHVAGGRWGEMVDAGPTWKLIDWMVHRGFSKAWISREIGQDGRALQLDRHRITRTAAERVAELDRRLGRSRRPPARRAGTSLPTLEEILAATQAAS